MKYYLHLSGETKGPFTLEMIREMLAAGVIENTTLIVQEGGSDWQSVADILAVVAASDAAVIKFYCPGCNAKISAESEFAGQVATCPSCGQDMEVPALPQMAPRGADARSLQHTMKVRQRSNKTKKVVTTSVGVAIMASVIFGVIHYRGRSIGITSNIPPSDSQDGHQPAISASHNDKSRSTDSRSKSTEQQRTAVAKVVKGIKATKDQPFVNSLSMQFVPVNIPSGPSNGTSVMFSVWETRQQDYAAYAKDVAGVNESWKDPKYASEETAPVIFVNSNDALSFCKWLTLKEKKAGIIPANAEYRLPTDYEWSCAVGIGDKEDWNESLELKSEEFSLRMLSGNLRPCQYRGFLK
jgi:hypothetical protein